MKSFIINSILFLILINPLFSYNDPSQIYPIAFQKGAGYRWWNLHDSVIISNYVTPPDYRKSWDTTLTNIEQTNMIIDTIHNKNKEPEIEKVLIGSMLNSQLTLFIEDSLISKAISEEVSEPLTIVKMLIHRDFDETLFFYIEGQLGKSPVVMRIKLFQQNKTELFITKDSFLEYCLSKRKCKSPAFADLFGCKCLNGSSKSVDYHRIEVLNLQNLSGE